MTDSRVSSHLHGLQKRIHELNESYCTEKPDASGLDFRQWLPETCLPKKPEPKLISMANRYATRPQHRDPDIENV